MFRFGMYRFPSYRWSRRLRCSAQLFQRIARHPKGHNLTCNLSSVDSPLCVKCGPAASHAASCCGFTQLLSFTARTNSRVDVCSSPLVIGQSRAYLLSRTMPAHGRRDGLGRKPRLRVLYRRTQVGRQSPQCKCSTVDPLGHTFEDGCQNLVQSLQSKGNCAISGRLQEGCLISSLSLDKGCPAGWRKSDLKECEESKV
jgi:hypothetical protein